MPVALVVRDVVLFPGMFRVVHVTRTAGLAVISRILAEPQPLAVVFQQERSEEDPFRAEVAKVGVMAQILRVIDMPDGTVRVLLEGFERARVSKFKRDQDCLWCKAVPIGQTITDKVRFEATVRELEVRYHAYVTKTGVSDSDHAVMGTPGIEPLRLADQVLGTIDLTYQELVECVQILDPLRLVQHALSQLAIATAQQQIHADINELVQGAMDKSQRDYQLKEQLKAIRAELGDSPGSEADADKFEQRIRAAKMPPEVQKEALREVGRLRRMFTESSEYTVLRTWIETLCDVPWGIYTVDQTNLRKAQQVLDSDHYGLEDVKERVLEFLAVRQLNPDSKAPVLCFVGPPGVGKTSLGRSIATSLGREFGRVALGGIKDETEIRGHRRTYIGSLPGRIIRSLIRTKTSNPVIVLDELDKVGNDFRGDPASALLEVLDPEQNHTFQDHYIDVPVDLSKVLFIGTANLQDPIPSALLDRLEVIEISGYTEEDKLQIARKFLLPKLAKNHGLTSKQIRIDKAALALIIRSYTWEAGLRGLNRTLAKLHRKVARQIVQGDVSSVRVTPAAVKRLLGPQKYYPELAERVDQPGIGIGLAWTAAGGEILFIEAMRMPGKRSLKLTGSLGDVMKESAEAALSWLRSHGVDLRVSEEAFEAEFHLHVPAGAIPKDGPSAGVTIVAALASVITGRCFKSRWAMTGEITLRGKVLPVGGVKEKALAARRAGVTDIVLPARNKNDLDEIPDVLREGLNFHFVETVDQVLGLVLEPA